MCKIKAVLVLFLSFIVLACSDPSNNKEPIDLSTGDTGWGVDQGGADTDPKTDTDSGLSKMDVLKDPVKATVRIVTFNVRKYFDDKCDSGQCGADDFEGVFTGAEFEFRGHQIADALKTLDADIIILQEIETEACIEIIADRLGFDHIEFGETFFNASLDVGVISKFAISDSKRHRDETTLMLSTGGTKKFTREFLQTEFEIEGEKVIVFGAHFKSKFNDVPSWRAAEAQAAKEIIDEEIEAHPNALVVLGGDLNDTLGSTTLENLTASGELIAASGEDTWTYNFGGSKDQIDHLIYADFDNIELSSVIAARSAGGSFSVSDHAALVATFKIR